MKKIVAATALSLALLAAPLQSQTAAPEKPSSDKASAKPEANDSRRIDSRPLKTFYLKNDTTSADGNEILTAMRLMADPSMKVYLSPSEKAISVRGSDQDLAVVEQLLAELDRPRKLYSITFTLNESDGGKRVGSQHFMLNATSGTRATLKQGSKVPIVTGAYAPGKTDQATQMTYLDIGLNFDVTPEEIAGGVSLKAKVEQSTVAPEASGIGATDPIIRQSVFESVSTVPLGRPTLIGALDVPGSTRHVDIEVQVDALK